jgi:hypothetical protein
LGRNCLLKYVTEGRIRVAGRRGRRGKQLFEDVKETRGYWKLQEEATGRIFYGEIDLEEALGVS